LSEAPTKPSKQPAEPARRRIYVSNSPRENQVRLATVRTALLQAGYAPLGYWSLLPTEDLQTALRKLIREADGAVVLVGPGALASASVASESVELLGRRTEELLGERRTREPFPVIPLLDEDMSPAEVRTGGLPALAELPMPAGATFGDRLTEAITILDTTFADAPTGVAVEGPARLVTTRVISAGAAVQAMALTEVKGRPTLVTGDIFGVVQTWNLGYAAGTTSDLRVEKHQGPVGFVTASRDVIVTSGAVDGRIQIWDATTGRGDEFLPTTFGVVRAIAMAPSGTHDLLLIGNDNVLAVWDPDRFISLMPFEHPDVVNDVAVDEDYAGTAVTACADGNVRACSLGSGDQPVVLRGHTGPVTCVAVDEDVIFSAGEDGTVRRWDVQTGQETHRFNAGGVLALTAGVIDGVSTVAIGGRDGVVRLWDPFEGTTTTLAGHSGSVTGLAIGTIDEKSVVVSGSLDGTVRIWGAAAADQVDWLSDAPSQRDLLHRRPLARAIADQLRRMNDEEPGTSFLVHIDGSWGAGKSTLLNFLDAELRSAVENHSGFVTVPFDAWREAGVGPAWWALLTALRDSIRKQRGWPARFWLSLTESAARLRRVGAPFLLALVGLLILAGGVLWLFTPVDLKGLQDTAAAITGVLAAVGTLWAGALVAGRFLLWDSARGARLFEQSNTNPMLEVTRHFGWLLRKSSKPVVFLVDDLDRCSDAYVVELLDSVQTLVRDSGPPSAHFVVSADGAWIRTSYELHYATFADVIAEPGQPLGYLFLDKFFQLRIPVPAIDATRQRQYLRELLRGPAAPPRPATFTEEESQVRAQLDRSVTETQVVDTLRAASDEVRDRVAGAALDKLTTPEAVAATEHSLQRFAVLLPPNPRTMKRFVNAYSAMRAVRTLEGNPIRVESLALWTIIEIRWPSLADHLRGRPESITLVGQTGADLGAVPETLRPLLADPALRVLTGFDPTTPFDANLVKTCCGIGGDQA